MQSSGKLGVAALVGLLLLVAGCGFGWYGFSAIISHMIQKEAVLRNGTSGFEAWLEPTNRIAIYMQFIMFNITNGDEVKRGARPIIQEVGPFSYREQRTRHNISWSDDGSEITYKEVVRYYFDPDTSGPGVNETTNITTINAPLLMLKLRMGGNSLTDFLTDILFSDVVEKLFISKQVREILFDGSLEDGLISLQPAIPMLCETGSCGSERDVEMLMTGRFRPAKYNGSVAGPYTVNTGDGDMADYNRLISFNNMHHLSYWNNTFCNMINGSDGSGYPPGMQHVQRIYVFNSDLCRSIYLDYEEDVSYFDITTRRYTPPRSLLENPDVNPDNRCFCPPNGHCLKAGAMSLSACQSGAPVVASTPHFYNGDAQYVDDVIGLAPDKEMHQTFIDIEPITGLPLNGAKRIQINLDLSAFRVISGLEELPNILLPIMYTNETARIDSAGAAMFKSRVQTPLNWLRAVQWLLISAGGLLLLVSVTGWLRARSQRQTKRGGSLM